MSNHSHYFLAIPLPDTVKWYLADWSNSIRNLTFDYKEWVHEKDFHITVKFLGGVADIKLKEMLEPLQYKVSTLASFSMKGDKVGTFGTPKTPRVLWAGVQSDPVLFDNQKVLDPLFSKFGFTRENRPYRPHITIAKKWVGGTLDVKTLPQLPSELENQWRVDHLVLYKIHPSKQPKYEEFASFQLK